MSNLQFHDAANIFPLLNGDEFDGLVEDIRSNGQRETIKLLDGLILDGRNRYRACLMANREPRTEVVSTDDPVAYVLSLNLHRRQLTPSQMSMVGARAKDVFEKLAKERQKVRKGEQSGSTVENLPQLDTGKARDQAGKAVGVSGKSIDYASKVIEKGTPELIKAVDEGRMAVSTAAILASEPAEVQTETLANPKLNRVYKKKDEQPEADFGKPLVADEVTSAIGFAYAAISQLERIQKKDPKRLEAFLTVEKWINKERAK